MPTEFAPAKLNLCLHVTGQRADGYHLLDSFVVFCDIGDLIDVTASNILSLSIEGPQSANLTVAEDNLVLRAARLMQVPAAIRLTKNLPVSSGIGGGSADAAATLRALARLTGKPLPDAEAVLSLGADVPVCLAGTSLRMRGVGEKIAPTPRLPATYVLLANPGIGVATPAVFRALDEKTNAPLPEIPAFVDAAEMALWLLQQRNDLEPAATSLVPMIAQVKSAIAAQPGCLIARMSGSGATCFGLFARAEQAEAAGRALRHAQPQWWLASGKILRD